MFPENEDEQQTILSNIENIVNDITDSPMDLEFLRELVQDSYDEEIAFMNFEPLTSIELQKLPWSSIGFEATRLTKGSTILNFNITFERPPENLEDVNVYRLMELFIRTAIENITFIKRVDPEPASPIENRTRSFSFNLKSKYATIDNELQNKILNHVRGTIKEVFGDTNDNINDEGVEHVFSKLLSATASKEIHQSLKTLRPVSLRKLIKEVSKISEKDSAKINFRCDSRTGKAKCIKTNDSSSTHWLFPYDFRRINDLSDQDQIDIMAKHTEILPRGFEVKLMTSLAPIISLAEIDSLQRGALGLSPYLTIMKTFSENGGTIGKLLIAMDEMKQSRNVSPQDADLIDEYKAKVEEIRDNSFDAILDNIHCPSQIPHVRSMQDFKHMYENHQQKLKTNALKTFTDLESIPQGIKEGDQLWIYHKRPLMRSYAHVVIVGQQEKFIHVATPDLTLMLRSRAKICEGYFNILRRDNDLCFIVRPDNNTVDRETKFRERAEACLGISLDYDADTCNCETFANGVHGLWGPGVQVVISLDT